MNKTTRISIHSESISPAWIWTWQGLGQKPEICTVTNTLIQYESELAKLRLHVQPVSVRKEAPLNGIFMSNPVRLNFTGIQLESICVWLYHTFFLWVHERVGWWVVGGGVVGGIHFGLYHPLSPTFLCSLAQVMVNSLLQMKLVSLVWENDPYLHVWEKEYNKVVFGFRDTHRGRWGGKWMDTAAAWWGGVKMTETESSTLMT